MSNISRGLIELSDLGMWKYRLYFSQIPLKILKIILFNFLFDAYQVIENCIFLELWIGFCDPSSLNGN